METLVIYDLDGYLISTGDSLRVPSGIPYILKEIPKNKRLKIDNGICVDVSVTPHQLILEDIPKTEIEELRDYIDELEMAMVDMMSIITGGAL